MRSLLPGKATEMTGIHRIEGHHLTEELTAAWLDGDLTGDERASVAAHLAECDACRVEMAELRRLLNTRAPRRRRRHTLVAAAAAAAAILFITGPIVRDNAERIRGDADRPEGTSAVVEAVSPADGAVVANVGQFVWHDAGAGVQYTLTLTDEAGSVVWTAATRDTLLPLPTSVRLEQNRRYFWYVDALLEGGEAATTGVRRFETAP